MRSPIVLAVAHGAQWCGCHGAGGRVPCLWCGPRACVLCRTVQGGFWVYKQAMTTPLNTPDLRSNKAWAEVPDRIKHKREEVPTLDTEDDGLEPLYERQEALQNMWHKNSVR